ncbi:flavin-dependent oxidoreductase [Pelagibius sp. 7325]|uniref:flavin-dependent oxidoreductase n=1 Tax=Pelagibius sp. 7325 TaxID=3131994 RepID=UPI0030EFA051
MTVLVAGAGIGGLTLALSLHQAGVPVTVFESSAEIKPLGVGINLLPHAVRELDELGLLDRLDALGVRTAELAYYSKRGQLIWSEPRGEAAGYRWPQFSVHRGALQMMLLEAARERLGPQGIITGRHLDAWEETADGVAAQFSDKLTGAAVTAAGSLLVGADGIHSALRRTLYPDEGAPIWNGAILWRGTARAKPYLTGRSMIMAGHEFQKFVAYPISAPDGDGNATINFIAERKFAADHQWRREDWNRPGDLADFLPQFEDWRFDWLDVPALIRAAAAVYEYPMVDRDPLPRWSEGRATLLGDAAHAMYPIGSNGASQAILDARVLTREILAHGMTAEALQAYEAERRPATAKIVLANRQNGPEQVMQRVEELAPDGFRRIADVMATDELEETARRYKQLAGFDKDALNSRPSIVPAPALPGAGPGSVPWA